MSDRPFFSIIVPTLNEATVIERLLTDLTKQTEKSFEVLVVDGNSKDETVKKSQGFEKKLPLTTIKSTKPNLCFQRNLGAVRAKGKYLVFFDADAQVPQRYLTEVHQMITSTNADYLTTLIRADSRNQYDRMLVRLMNIAFEISLIIERPFVLGGNFTVSKVAFTTVEGFREEVVHAEDYDLSVRLFKAGYKLRILKKPRLIFSLRRYRYEGRLKVLRKNAQATLHVFTKGAITRDIFSYPMGGLLYKIKPRDEIKPQVLEFAEERIKQFLKVLTQ